MVCCDCDHFSFFEVMKRNRRTARQCISRDQSDRKRRVLTRRCRRMGANQFKYVEFEYNEEGNHDEDDDDEEEKEEEKKEAKAIVDVDQKLLESRNELVNRIRIQREWFADTATSGNPSKDLFQAQLRQSHARIHELEMKIQESKELHVKSIQAHSRLIQEMAEGFNQMTKSHEDMSTMHQDVIEEMRYTHNAIMEEKYQEHKVKMAQMHSRFDKLMEEFDKVITSTETWFKKRK